MNAYSKILNALVSRRPGRPHGAKCPDPPLFILNYLDGGERRSSGIGRRDLRLRISTRALAGAPRAYPAGSRRRVFLPDHSRHRSSLPGNDRAGAAQCRPPDASSLRPALRPAKPIASLLGIGPRWRRLLLPASGGAP